MAEEEKTDQELDEATELEHLLEEGEEEAVQKGQKFSPKAIWKRLKSNKILLSAAIAGLVVFLGGGGFLVYYLTQPEVKETTPQAGEGKEAEEAPQKPEQQIEKVHIYQLDPFFLPVKTGGRETGRFISVRPNLLLSNPALDEEVDKVLPLVRKNIYNILRRKSPGQLLQKKLETEEKIKSEILAAANALLLSGTGTITDVYFAEFIVK